MIQEFDPPLKIAFVERRHEYDDVYTFVFRPKIKFEFIAGQNARIVIPQLSEEEGKRSLSIAASPHEETIQFSVHTNSKSPFKEALINLEEGDEINLIKVKGKTMIPENNTRPIILIAGGVGMTPYRSIILNLKKSNKLENIRLIHVSNGSYLYEEELKNLPFEQQRIRRPEVESTISETAKEFRDALYFVVGSPSFFEAIEKMLKNAGIEEEVMFISKFVGYENELD